MKTLHTISPESPTMITSSFSAPFPLEMVTPSLSEVTSLIDTLAFNTLLISEPVHFERSGLVIRILVSQNATVETNLASI